MLKTLNDHVKKTFNGLSRKKDYWKLFKVMLFRKLKKKEKLYDILSKSTIFLMYNTQHLMYMTSLLFQSCHSLRCGQGEGQKRMASVRCCLTGLLPHESGKVGGRKSDFVLHNNRFSNVDSKMILRRLSNEVSCKLISLKQEKMSDLSFRFFQEMSMSVTQDMNNAQESSYRTILFTLFAFNEVKGLLCPFESCEDFKKVHVEAMKTYKAIQNVKNRRRKSKGKDPAKQKGEEDNDPEESDDAEEEVEKDIEPVKKKKKRPVLKRGRMNILGSRLPIGECFHGYKAHQLVVIGERYYESLKDADWFKNEIFNTPFNPKNSNNDKHFGFGLNMLTVFRDKGSNDRVFPAVRLNQNTKLFEPGMFSVLLSLLIHIGGTGQPIYYHFKNQTFEVLQTLLCKITLNDRMKHYMSRNFYLGDFPEGKSYENMACGFIRNSDKQTDKEVANFLYLNVIRTGTILGEVIYVEFEKYIKAWQKRVARATEEGKKEIRFPDPLQKVNKMRIISKCITEVARYFNDVGFHTPIDVSMTAELKCLFLELYSNKKLKSNIVSKSYIKDDDDITILHKVVTNNQLIFLLAAYLIEIGIIVPRFNEWVKWYDRDTSLMDWKKFALESNLTIERRLKSAEAVVDYPTFCTQKHVLKDICLDKLLPLEFEMNVKIPEGYSGEKPPNLMSLKEVCLWIAMDNNPMKEYLMKEDGKAVEKDGREGPYLLWDTIERKWNEHHTLDNFFTILTIGSNFNLVKSGTKSGNTKSERSEINEFVPYKPYLNEDEVKYISSCEDPQNMKTRWCDIVTNRIESLLVLMRKMRDFDHDTVFDQANNRYELDKKLTPGFLQDLLGRYNMTKDFDKNNKSITERNLGLKIMVTKKVEEAFEICTEVKKLKDLPDPPDISENKLFDVLCYSLFHECPNEIFTRASQITKNVEDLRSAKFRELLKYKFSLMDTVLENSSGYFHIQDQVLQRFKARFHVKVPQKRKSNVDAIEPPAPKRPKPNDNAFPLIPGTPNTSKNVPNLSSPAGSINDTPIKTDEEELLLGAASMPSDATNEFSLANLGNPDSSSVVPTGTSLKPILGNNQDLLGPITEIMDNLTKKPAALNNRGDNIPLIENKEPDTTIQKDNSKVEAWFESNKPSMTDIDVFKASLSQKTQPSNAAKKNISTMKNTFAKSSKKNYLFFSTVSVGYRVSAVHCLMIGPIISQKSTRINVRIFPFMNNPTDHLPLKTIYNSLCTANVIDDKNDNFGDKMNTLAMTVLNHASNCILNNTVLQESISLERPVSPKFRFVPIFCNNQHQDKDSHEPIDFKNDKFDICSNCNYLYCQKCISGTIKQQDRGQLCCTTCHDLISRKKKA